MRTVRSAASLGVAVMAAAITYGVVAGSFTAEGGALLDLVWGQVTMVDLYLAFLAVWGWIAWREASPVRAAVWLVLVVTLGSLAIATYVLLAALRSRSVPDLLLGPRRGAPGA